MLRPRRPSGHTNRAVIGSPPSALDSISGDGAKPGNVGRIGCLGKKRLPARWQFHPCCAIIGRRMNLHRRELLGSLPGSALGLALAGLGGIAALWTAGIARFLTPNVTDQPPRTFKAGRPDQYADGQVETRYQPGHGVWVVRGRHGGRPQIFALRAACTHLGCVTQWHEGRQEFRCPCHGSAFTKEGKNVAGPAPRPLERLRDPAGRGRADRDRHRPHVPGTTRRVGQAGKFRRRVGYASA